jgi:hypothetical protein
MSSKPDPEEAPRDREAAGRDPPGDVLIGTLLALIALFVVVEAARMPERGPLGFFTSPGFVPLLVGAIALLLSVVLVAINVARGGIAGLGAWLRASVRQEETRRLGALVALISAYVLVLGWIPFWLATFLFLLAIFVYLRASPWWLMPVHAGAATFVVAWLLPWLFEMPVP